MAEDELSATELLRRTRAGEADAGERMMPLVYDELRRLAHQHLTRESTGATLSTTELVHEAYLKLIDQTRVDWQGRAHFLGVAAIAMRTTGEEVADVERVVTAAELIELQHLVRRVPVSPSLVSFAVRLARATRPSGEASPVSRKYVAWGAGPRASQFLVLGAKARAASRGAAMPSYEDVRAVAYDLSLQEQLLATRKKEAAEINARYDEEKRKYRELTGRK